MRCTPPPPTTPHADAPPAPPVLAAPMCSSAETAFTHTHTHTHTHTQADESGEVSYSEFHDGLRKLPYEPPIFISRCAGPSFIKHVHIFIRI